MSEDWETVIAQLARRVASDKLTQNEIAHATGVDQGQISRILAGHAKRHSRNVERLCVYARSLRFSASDVQPARRQIQEAIDQVWDGSPEHARAIAEAVTSLGRVQRAFARGVRKK